MHYLFQKKLLMNIFIGSLLTTLLFYFPGFGTNQSSGFVTVTKMKYNGYIHELKDKNIKVDTPMVALDSDVRVKKPANIVINEKKPPAIFFIIDHSGSMYKNANANDPQGSRFRVTRDILDTIKKHLGKEAEIGVSVFNRLLYFQQTNDPSIFNKTASDTGAYIRLLNLDEQYASQIGNKNGYDILRNYLETIQISNYIDLKYRPIPMWPDTISLPSTNITAAFRAAKEAFKNAKIQNKNRHFIIFLSDGEATAPKNDSTTLKEFIEGKDVPTTFTVYFTQQDAVPPSINQMTENIKKNGYSDQNKESKYFAIKTNYDTLMKLLTKEVLSIMSSETNSLPDTLKLNDIEGIKFNVEKEQFEYKDLFPLRGKTTDFTYRIKYRVKKVIDGNETITDSLDEGKFSIEIEKGSVLGNTYILKSWSRKLEFYSEGKPISTVNENTDKLELRFAYDAGDANYSYSNTVKVRIRTKNAGDNETFTLEKKNDYYSVTFDHTLIFDTKANGNNGVLQSAINDAIYATFFNTETPQLPLDTLMVALPVKATVVEVELKPIATNPSYIKENMVKNPSINQKIISILSSDNKKQLDAIKVDGDYKGMLIQAVPIFENPEKLVNFEASGKLTIYDPLRNVVREHEPMGFNKEKKTLNFVWDFKNSAGRSVGEGSYLVVINAKKKFYAAHKGINQDLMILIGLKK